MVKLLSASIIVFLFSANAIAQPGNNEPPATSGKFIPEEKTIFYKLADKTIPVSIMQFGDETNIACINLHDNENTSVEASKSVLELKGGKLIKIGNNHQRVIRFRLRGVTYGFDPNRIFSRAGIEETLKENGRTSSTAIAEVEKFADRLLMLIPENTSCIVALHNNTDEEYSVTTYLPGNRRQYDAKAVYADSLQDVDDIAFTTDRILYQKMADNGYNSIWQDNDNARRDGSLSIYCGEKNIRYINIETQHGKFDQYAEMLGKLLTILADENKNASETSHDSRQIPITSQKTVDNK
jgi:hypothetical protein